MSSPTDLAGAAQALAAALLAATADPATAVRLLSSLANFSPDTAVPASPQGSAIGNMQTATGDLCRRAAVVALARASTTYQPASYNDAATLRSLVCDLLDNEITIAGDEGEDTTYEALRELRVAVVQDLTTRGASLAAITTFSFNASLPALTLATRIYRDPSRADQLVTQTNPIHPAFLPATFQALAS